MAITLPYPTLSGAFTITGGATIQVFAPTTVHNDVNHNNPHAKLLANDNALKGAVDTLQAQSAGTLTRIVPVELYKMSNYVVTQVNVPLEYRTASAINVVNNGTWQTHSYPVGVPTPAISVLVKCVSYTGSSGEAYIRLRKTTSPLFPDDIISFSFSSHNDDDAASDTSTVEMPYHASRTFESFCAGNTLYTDIIFIVGYRS